MTASHTHMRYWDQQGLKDNLWPFWLLGEVSLLLINFRTDILSQKHFQCQHCCVDICILKRFRLLHLFLNIFSSSSCFYHCAFQLLLFLPEDGWMCCKWKDLVIFSKGAMKVSKHILENDILPSSVLLSCTGKVPLIIHLNFVLSVYSFTPAKLFPYWKITHVKLFLVRIKLVMGKCYQERRYLAADKWSIIQCSVLPSRDKSL